MKLLILSIFAGTFLFYFRKGVIILANINETLIGIKTRLTEATTEILALIEQLQTEQLTPEGREALDSIKTGVDNLADIVPNTPPPQP